jgi:Alternative complex III, ActD subunit
MSSPTLPAPALYGVMAEFDDTTALVNAARRAYDEGYRRFDAYSPFPIHDVFDAMHLRDRRIDLIVLAGGLTGMFTGIGLQIWVSAVAYPLNIGGRPYISWPMFIPVTFELTILFAAFAAVFGMLGLNGLPMPYHPVFNVERCTAHASQDRFFLAIEASDTKFERDRTRAFLQSLGAKEVNDVEE